jgi:hypothetical protein
MPPTPQEFQTFIAAASIAILQAAVLFLAHILPSQIHYSLNTVSKIF